MSGQALDALHPIWREWEGGWRDEKSKRLRDERLKDEEPEFAEADGDSVRSPRRPRADEKSKRQVAREGRAFLFFGEAGGVEPWGFEPQTSSMPLRRSTN